MEGTLKHVSPSEMDVGLWANLLRRHIQEADITLDEVEDYLVVQRYEGPLVLPQKIDHGVIVVSEDDGRYFLEHKEEIFARAASLLKLTGV